MYQLAIIGAGNLGYRHLQGLLQLELDCNINIVDVSSTTLDHIKNKLKKLNKSNRIKKIDYFQDVKCLPKYLDYAVVSTNSDVRFNLIELLLESSKIRYLLLEKVLFQKISDYYNAIKLLDTHNVKSWVNCPRRAYQSYDYIKNYFAGEKLLYGQVYGGDWGLGCNGIHFIDIFSNLNNSKILFINSKRINKKIIESKRYGFIEFTGSLHGEFENGFKFEITSLKDTKLPIIITLRSMNNLCIIDETNEKVIFYNYKTCKLEYREHDIPLLSSLVPVLVKEILLKGESSLPSITDSIDSHLPFITSLLKVLKFKISDDDICPIT